MNENIFIDFSNLNDLLQWLNVKYSKKNVGYKSSSRYPSTLIFFDSKTAYIEFLKRTSFEKRYLSEIIPINKNKLNCHLVQKWIDEIINDSFNIPLIMLPITEYIRLCKITDDRILDEVFTKLLQTEDASLIIPMLDYSHNYKHFFRNFVHRGRMAEVCQLNEESIDDLNIIELTLDSSTLVPEDNMYLIRDTKQWVQLWESENIKTYKKILIKEPQLIASISTAEITIPKIDKRSILNELDLLANWYNINPSVISIEPDKKIWKYIFEKLNSYRKESPSWKKIVTSVLGDISDLEYQYSELWEKSLDEKKYIARWFWLNEAKKTKFTSQFINEIVTNTDNPEMFIDVAWIRYVESPNIDTINKDTLNERTEFFKALKQPLFHSGNEELKNIFSSFVSNKEINDKYLYITETFDFERKYLIQYLKDDLNNSEISKYPLLYSKIKDIWSPLSFYLEKPLNHLNDIIPSILDDFTNYSETYIKEYKLSKFINDCRSSKLKELNKEYLDNFISIVAKKNNRDIPSLEDQKFLNTIRSEDFIFIDGAGLEWCHTIIRLLEQRNWQVLDKDLRIANLPTDTKHSEVNTGYVGKFRSFDELLHQPYKYPETIYKELVCIQEIVNEIDEKYKSRKKPLYIVSDHGSTVFARKGICQKINGLNPDHGGRYAYYSGSEIEEKEHVYTTEDNKGKIVVPLSYVNFDSQNPKGEAHGGGTLEEILAFSVKLAPPSCDISKQDQIVVEPRQYRCSTFDKNIGFDIHNYPSDSIRDIMISVNDNPPRNVETEYIESGGISFPVSKLIEYGLVVGKNTIEINIDYINKSKVNIEFVSSSQKTDFDTEFDF